MAEPLDTRPVRRVELDPLRAGDVDRDRWPCTLAPVRHLLDHGLELPPGVTFLVGENGSGKSTLVEAVAMAAGLNAEGGTRHARHRTHETESDLHAVLRLVRSGGRAWSYFLRAETMHGLYTYLGSLGPTGGPDLHRLSHGESFLEVLRGSFHDRGFYLLDEPESALSFAGQLALVGVLDEVARRGGQALCATHSPLLCALPGATILQVDERGLTPTAWADLELVQHWQRYLAAPDRYLRHLLDHG